MKFIVMLFHARQYPNASCLKVVVVMLKMRVGHGRRVSSLTDGNIQRVQQMILDNRQITENEFAIEMNILHGSVHTIISEHLKF